MTNMDKDWLKPMFFVLGFVAFIMLLLNLNQIFPDISWSTLNPQIITIIPYIILFGIGLIALAYITQRKY